MDKKELSKKELAALKLAHREARRNERAKLADKIKAVYLLGSGWKISDISEALLLDDNTIYRYNDIYLEKGLSGLSENNHKGRELYLMSSEMNDLDSFLQEQPCRTTKQAIQYVEQEFGVTYSISGMNALLKKLGYTYKKPKVVPGKANKEAQKKFIKKYENIRNNMELDDSLFFMDGVHPQHNPIIQYGWFKKGAETIINTNARHHRLNINGVIDIDTKEVIVHNHASLNEEATLDMLEELRKFRPKGKIYLVLDNAGYYNTKRVKEFAQHTEIILLYLPPYSPNLNLIERLWGLLQRETLYNHYYSTFDEFKQACGDFFMGLPDQQEKLQTLFTEKFETLPI